MPQSRSIAVPFAAACLGIAFFSAMDAAMKGVSIAIGAYNAMLWRSLIGSLAMGGFFLVTRQAMPSRQAMRLHLIRGAITSSMAVLFFWGVVRVPLAEAIAISFIAPLIALYLAAVVLGEAICPRAIIGSLLGLSGVAVILVARARGAYGPEALPGAVAVLGSAVLYAVNIVLMRKQALVAAPLEVATFQNVTTLAFLALAAPFIASSSGLGQLPGLTLSAALAICSLLLLSWAYARAEAQSLIAVEYTAFGWAALFGWLIFDESITWPVLAGTGLIVIGCIVAARRGKAAEDVRMEAAI
jgi:S-adenosylmethionine uptake transporter